MGIMGARKLLRSYIYIAFALIMLIVSWESNLASAALLNPNIPEQSIRIRILAHSDRVEDQWIKKEVRDAITASVNEWNLSSEQIEDARNEVNSRLPQLRALVGALLTKHGFTYGYQVELSKVHFPAKIFQRTSYPAGEYEALRITLGEGKGQNWWCVLFPPLCFGSAIKITDVQGIAVDQTVYQGTSPEGNEAYKVFEQARNGGNSQINKSVYQAPVQGGDQVEVKFFLVEKFKKFSGFLKNRFT